MYACLGQASSGTECGSPAGSTGFAPAFMNSCLRAPAGVPRRACVTSPTGGPSAGGPLASPSCVNAHAHTGGHARNGAQGLAWRAGSTALSRFVRCSGAVQRSPKVASANRNVSLLPMQPGSRTLAVLQGVEFRLLRAPPQRAVLRSGSRAPVLAFSDNWPNPSFERTASGYRFAPAAFGRGRRSTQTLGVCE